MPTNRYFQNVSFAPEQELLQSLTDEMIASRGIDVFYLPRTHVNIDALFLADPLSRFDQAVKVAVYLKTFEGFNGAGDLMSKFGFSVEDRMTLSMSVTEFQKEVGFRFQMSRPHEGDLIYFPLTKGLFEIKFTEHEAVFYQSGTLTFYDLTAEKFSFSGEKFDTGLTDVDNVDETYSLVAQEHSFISEDEEDMYVGEDTAVFIQEGFDPDAVDLISQNKEFHDEAQDLLDWSEKDPFSESGYSGST